MNEYIYKYLIYNNQSSLVNTNLANIFQIIFTFLITILIIRQHSISNITLIRYITLHLNLLYYTARVI